MNIKNLFLLSLLAGICSIASAADEVLEHPQYPDKLFRMAKTFPGSNEEVTLGAEPPFGYRKTGTDSITTQQALEGIRADFGKHFKDTDQQLQLYDKDGRWLSPDLTPYTKNIYIGLGAEKKPYLGEIKIDPGEGSVWDAYYKGKGPGYSGHDYRTYLR